jgi:hypothetical protein
MPRCVLYDRECIECGECQICDLDPQKICDNCCRCIQTQDDYKEVLIDAVLTPEQQQAFSEDLAAELEDNRRKKK